MQLSPAAAIVTVALKVGAVTPCRCRALVRGGVLPGEKVKLEQASFYFFYYLFFFLKEALISSLFPLACLIVLGWLRLCGPCPFPPSCLTSVVAVAPWALGLFRVTHLRGRVEG